MKIIFEIMEPLERSLERFELLREHIDCIKISQACLYEKSFSFIREIKDRYPEKTILADTRIMTDDVQIAEKAVSNGADMVSVCSSADIDTIDHTVAYMKDQGKKTMIAVIGVEPRSFTDIAKKINSSKADMACFYFEGSLYRDEPGIFARKDAIGKLSGIELKAEKAVCGSITTEYIEEISRAGVAAVDLGYILNRNIHAENIAKRFREI